MVDETMATAQRITDAQARVEMNNNFERRIVLIENVQLGDVICDLGFTVHARFAGVNTITLEDGGDMEIRVLHGREIQVYRPISS